MAWVRRSPLTPCRRPTRTVATRRSAIDKEYVTLRCRASPALASPCIGYPSPSTLGSIAQRSASRSVCPGFFLLLSPCPVRITRIWPGKASLIARMRRFEKVYGVGGDMRHFWLSEGAFPGGFAPHEQTALTRTLSTAPGLFPFNRRHEPTQSPLPTTINARTIYTDDHRTPCHVRPRPFKTVGDRSRSAAVRRILCWNTGEECHGKPRPWYPAAIDLPHL